MLFRKFENYLKVWHIFLEDSGLLFYLAVEDACLSRHHISAINNVGNFYHLIRMNEAEGKMSRIVFKLRNFEASLGPNELGLRAFYDL